MIRQADYGGTERQLTELAKAIDRSKFLPHVGCLRGGGVRSEELLKAGALMVDFEVRSFASPSIFRSMRKMARYIREQNIQVVHTFDAPATLFGVFTARLFGGPIVISSQRAFRDLVSPATRALLRITDRLADAIVVNCKAVRDHMVADERVPPRKLRLCYNSIDTEKMQRSARWRPPEVGNASVVIGCLCCFRPEKDLRSLMDAFANVLKVRPGVKLLLVGDGPCLPDLQEHSRRLGITGDCVFIPAVLNVPEWLHAIDVFVLPSISEALSNSLMEAMASGCCAIASRVGGNGELIQHGVNGLIFERCDVAALTASLLTVVDDRELREQLSRSAADSIRESFSVRESVSRMETIYMELLAATGGAP